MTSRDIKESYRSTVMLLMEKHGQELSALPRVIKEAIRIAMLEQQAEEDKVHANEYFDLMFYADRGC